jgi:hypothetical protein
MERTASQATGASYGTDRGIDLLPTIAYHLRAQALFFMAIVNSYSFSHKFSDDREVMGYSSYQDIVYQSNASDTLALMRDFHGFLLGCGHHPVAVVEAMITVAEEYGQSHCKHEGSLVWKETEDSDGANSTERGTV